MHIAKISARGQTTIPLSIRKAAHIHAGDTLAFEIEGDHVIVRNITFPAEGYMKGIEETLNEWDTTEDEVAWDAL
jgi:antitoxin PrlF